MVFKKTIVGFFGVATVTLGATDAAVLNEKPLNRVELIGEERVEAKQIGNIVETTLPWKDQNPLKVVYDMGEPTIDERLKDKRKKEVITESIDYGDGGFKVDIILNEKPDSNVFCYSIEGTENYDFFYQPPLTEQEKKEGKIRPENIEGSYAVYHKTLKNNEYKAGKVMHIPRPQVWSLSDEENKVWADLQYTKENKLCVTVPQDFFDNAMYPVRVDPTFGYTSQGASGQITLADTYGMSATGVSGTLNSVSAYVALTAGSGANTQAFKVGADSDPYLDNIFSTTESNSLTTSFSLVDVTASSESLVGSTLYVHVDPSLANSAQVAYDNGVATNGGHVFDDDGSWITNNTKLFSVWADYSTPEFSTLKVTGGGAVKVHGGSIMVR